MKKILFIFLLLSSNSFSQVQYKKEWYCFEKSFGSYTCRMMVPHGWLVYTQQGYGATMVFLPDEKYEWN